MSDHANVYCHGDGEAYQDGVADGEAKWRGIAEKLAVALDLMVCAMDDIDEDGGPYMGDEWWTAFHEGETALAAYKGAGGVL
jgi:hypothetical protein